eukprot:6410156-Prymnesium_polylepis.1
MWLQNVAFTPKLKLVVGFFQSIAFLPPVYGLSLPEWYYHWVSFLNIFESAQQAFNSDTVDWSGIAVPGACLEGGFHSRVLLRGIGPLTPMVIVSILGWLISRGRSIQKSLPLILFITFVLVGPTSSSIFAAWTCETYALNSIAEPPTTTAFLLADLSLKCDSSDGEYAKVESLAYIFVVIWPVGVP